MLLPRKKQLIIEKYPNGFSFEPTALRLVEGKIGEKLDEIDIAEMKQEMFQRQDEVYLFVEQIASEKNRKEIVETAEHWIDSFGCFSLDALFEKYAVKIKNIFNVEDFGTFLEKLHYPLEAYKTIGYPIPPKCYLTRPIGITKEIALQKLAQCIKEVIDEKYSAADYEIMERIPALNGELLIAVVKDKIPQVIKTENNGVQCFQFSENHLPDDLETKIKGIIEQFERINLPLSQEALHTALSLAYNCHFNEMYMIPDMKSFRQLAAMYYKNEDRNWKNNVFVKLTK